MSRMPAGSFAPRRAAAFVALPVGACLLLAACSPGADYPSLFPAVHDIPPPRTDTPLDANQVQQATEDLISARDRLNTEAQSGQSKTANSPASPGKSSARTSSAKTSSVKSSSKAAAGPDAPKKPPSSQASGVAGSGGAQTAGAESK